MKIEREYAKVPGLLPVEYRLVAESEAEKEIVSELYDFLKEYHGRLERICGSGSTASLSELTIRLSGEERK